jgi:hypothetical protein
MQAQASRGLHLSVHPAPLHFFQGTLPNCTILCFNNVSHHHTSYLTCLSLHPSLACLQDLGPQKTQCRPPQDKTQCWPPADDHSHKASYEAPPPQFENIHRVQYRHKFASILPSRKWPPPLGLGFQPKSSIRPSNRSISIERSLPMEIATPGLKPTGPFQSKFLTQRVVVYAASHRDASSCASSRVGRDRRGSRGGW